MVYSREEAEYTNKEIILFYSIYIVFILIFIYMVGVMT
jgi:hypothetical protein